MYLMNNKYKMHKRIYKFINSITKILRYSYNNKHSKKHKIDLTQKIIYSQLINNNELEI